MTRAPLGLALATLLFGCDPVPSEGDAGSCAATVTLGTYDDGVFTPVADGDPAELVLGFQGFRMLSFALHVELARAPVDEAEVSAFVEVPETSIELSQRTREPIVGASEGGFDIDQWLVFFNDVPPAEVVGRSARVEAIVRASGCVGGTSVTVTIRDDDDCVDPTITLDAGFIDAGPGEASVCEGVTP